MKSYVMLHTRLRAAAKIEFDNDFVKLINNSGFESREVFLADYWEVEKIFKYVMKPNFKDWFPFLKGLFAVEMEETEIKTNKLVYFGPAMLDLNKTLMYEFHYD